MKLEQRLMKIENKNQIIHIPKATPLKDFINTKSKTLRE